MLLSQITKAYYINLPQRNDRLRHIQKELAKISLAAERQEGILGSDGEGCASAHRSIISKIQPEEIYLIIEDDAIFYDEFQHMRKRPSSLCQQNGISCFSIIIPVVAQPKQNHSTNI